MRIFRIKGVIVKRKLVRGKYKKEGLPSYRKVIMPFEVEIPAYNEKHALEKIYSVYGGVHRVKRTQIKILEIKEIKPEEVEDVQLRKMINVLYS